MKVIHSIPGFPGGHCIPVMSADDYSFSISSSRMKEPLVFRDEELQANENGDYVINIEALDLKFFYQKSEIPKEFIFPQALLNERAERRKENAIRKDSIFSMIYQEKRLYFYIQDDKLIIKLFGLKDDGKLNTEPERETAADKIEIIHNRKAVNAKKLKLGHPYFELPVEVAQKFEKVLQEKELRTLALVPAGISQLNGKEYYRLSVDIPAGMWNQVKSYFEDFGKEGTMQGLLTCYPDQVKTILKI